MNIFEKKSDRWRAYFVMEYENTLSGFRNIGETIRHTPAKIENILGALKTPKESPNTEPKEQFQTAYKTLSPQI